MVDPAGGRRRPGWSRPFSTTEVARMSESTQRCRWCGIDVEETVSVLRELFAVAQYLGTDDELLRAALTHPDDLEAALANYRAMRGWKRRPLWRRRRRDGPALRLLRGEGESS